MARRSQEKLSRGNRRGMVVIAGVVAVLLVVFMVQSRQISVKNASYESQKEELTQKLQDEELRSGEIDKLKDYVNSTEFIEKMAREKLGLVYDDEIIFKAEKRGSKGYCKAVSFFVCMTGFDRLCSHKSV